MPESWFVREISQRLSNFHSGGEMDSDKSKLFLQNLFTHFDKNVDVGGLLKIGLFFQMQQKGL